MFVLPQLKKDIEFNKSLNSLVEVLKSIAVSHYHILERKIKNEEKFFAILRDFFAFPYLKQAQHPFLSNSDRPLGVIAITSDMGLLGGLNMKVMTMAFEEAKAHRSKLIVIGEKGHALARDKKLSFVAFPGVKDEERFSQAMSLRDFVTEEVLAGKIGSLEVIFPEPVSFLIQKVKKVVLLPFAIPEVNEANYVSVANVANVIIESNLSDIIEYLVTLYIGQMFYEMLGFSRLSELSARFIHLESSSQKLKDIEKQLRLSYFRVRHEIIDKGMREIFAARSVYANERK